MKSVFVLKKNGRALTQHDVEADLVMWYERMRFISALMNVTGCPTHDMHGSVGIVIEETHPDTGHKVNYNVFHDGCPDCARATVEPLERLFGPMNREIHP